MPHIKYYALSQSPLYGLSNKKKLLELLKINRKEALILLKPTEKLYNIFSIDDKPPLKKINPDKIPIIAPKEKRIITSPIPLLKKVQKKIHELLSRIQKPAYLFSGVKKLCYIDNAKQHLDAKHLLNIDIQKFYPNCSREYVFKCFKQKFKMAEDIAWILTDFTTFNKVIPTGSPSSQLLAFFAYQDMFDKMQNIARSSGFTFSLFVDDMTFSSSSKPIPKSLPHSIDKELRLFGHSLKRKKTRFNYSKEYKIVTGCAISPSGQIRVRNAQRESILADLQNTNATSSEKKALKGRIQAARQIEPKIFQSDWDKLNNKKIYEQKNSAI